MHHPPEWQCGIEYKVGDVVKYQEHGHYCHFKNIQAHRSQDDWRPPCVPALWGKIPDDDSDSCHQQPHYQEYPQQQQQQQQQQHQSQHPEQTPPSYYADEKKPEPAPEAHQHWYEDKKRLGIGAGVVGGAALLAGGLFAYKKHEEHKEEGKVTAWAHDKWIQEARARTDELKKHGSTGPAAWVLTHGKSIPNRAIVTGQERDRNLYTSRAFYEGALVIGKASDQFHKGCVIGYADDEIEIDEFEVLVGNMDALHWVSARGPLDVKRLGYRPVEGGHEKDGTPVYIVHAPYKDAEHPGKTSEKLDGAYITYGGKEKVIKEYQVLCHR